MMRLVSQRRCLRRETDSISVWAANDGLQRHGDVRASKTRREGSIPSQPAN